jgi:hypothetical protein
MICSQLHDCNIVSLDRCSYLVAYIILYILYIQYFHACRSCLTLLYIDLNVPSKQQGTTWSPSHLSKMPSQATLATQRWDRVRSPSVFTPFAIMGGGRVIIAVRAIVFSVVLMILDILLLFSAA